MRSVGCPASGVHDVGMDRISIGEHPEDNVVRLPGTGDAGGSSNEEMSYEEAIAADVAADVDDDARSGSAPGSQVIGLVEQGVRVGAGLFAAGASALADALRTTLPHEDEPTIDKDPAATLAGAGLGAAVTAAEAAAAAAKQVADTIGPAMTWLVEPRFAKEAGEMAAGAARLLDGQWKASQTEMVDAAAAFLGALVPEIAKGVADQVDLTALVRERVDVNAIADDIDVDRILERVDLDVVMARVDVDAIAARLDVDRVADRIDPGRLVARTDLVAIVDRLDLASIAEEVIDEIDLPRLVRESSGIMANETVQTVRVQGMNADRLVARVVDRVLRREARDLLPQRSDVEDRP